MKFDCVNSDFLPGRGSRSSTISLCYNTGMVSGMIENGYTHAGGLIGHMWRGGPMNIVNCYNTGNISGYSAIGGFFGDNESVLCGTINYTNCYTVGTVSASQNKWVCAFGGVMTNINFNNCFTTCSTWNPYETGCSYGNSSTITETQLKAYSSTLGSGFKADTKGINGGFPILAWQ